MISKAPDRAAGVIRKRHDLYKAPLYDVSLTTERQADSPPTVLRHHRQIAEDIATYGRPGSVGSF